MTRTSRRWFSPARKASPIRKARLRVHGLESREVPAGFVVTSTANAGANTLRQAILDANANGTGLDTITFSLPANSTITLGTELAITGSLQIDGPSALDLTVSGNKLTRAFNVANGAAALTVSLKNLRIVDCLSAGAHGGAIFNGGEDLTIANCVLSANTASGGVTGGAIRISNVGKLTLSDSTLSANSASSFGGAIYFAGGTTGSITNCTLQGNSTGQSGGAITVVNGTLGVTNSTAVANVAQVNGGAFFSSKSKFTLQSTTVSGNTAGTDGGGIRISDGTSTVLASTVSGNTAANGGGIYVSGAITAMDIRNATIANNVTTTNGAGIFFANLTGTVNLTNSTITGNAAGGGSGGGFTVYGGNPTVNLESSIISGNTTGGDFRKYFGILNVSKSAFQNTVGSFNDLGGNIVGPFANLKLGTLANNGGLVQTFRPQTGSPLISAGSNPGAVATDARGVSRSIGVTDIGAVEFVPTSLVVTTTADSSAGSLRQALNDANIDRDAGAATPVTITFDTAGAFSGNATIDVTSGELAITDSTLVQGPDVAERVTVKSNGSSRVFNTSGGAANMPVTLQRMTITGGSAATGGGVMVSDESVTLFQVHVTGNTASGLFQGGAGGFVSAGGTLTVQSSTLSANSAVSSAVGGAILARDTAALSISNSTVSGNYGENNGGGIYFNGSGSQLKVFNTTIVNNNSLVFPGNSGGLFVLLSSASIQIESSIISENSNNQIGQVQNPPFNITKSAIGSPTNFTFGTNSGNLIGQSLLLGPLQANGGFGGPTHRPGALSPLIDAGSNPGALGFDQTENFRTIGSAPDIGAVESRYTVVLNAKDAGPGSLRQAVQHGFSNAFNGTVTFDGSAFATAQTIALTSGEISINDDVSIFGPGANLVTVSGNLASRIFNTTSASPASTVTFSGMTLANGKSSGIGGAIVGDNQSLNIIDCALQGNSAGGNGGAIGMTNSGTLAITGSTLSGNTSADDGGAISTYSPLTVTNSTIAGNSATNGGGILTFATNSTISNSTVVNNAASASGGGIDRAGSGKVTLTSAIVSGNAAPSGPDLFSAGTVIANFSGVGSKSGVTTFTADATTNALMGQNFKLGALDDNGGPTQTMLPLLGSPLVDAGSNPASLTADQRGQQRTVGSQIDIGATEAVNLVVLNANDSGPGSLRQTLEHANSVAGADTVAFDPVFFATAHTITLASTLSITDAMTVIGPGARWATVSGNNSVRILTINTPTSGQAILLSGLTLAEGKFNGAAAIYNEDEDLTLSACTIRDNTATGTSGGAIFTVNAPGSLTVVGCTIADNSASAKGGALGANPGLPMTIRNSTLTANIAGDAGGAIVGNTVTIQNSTLTANSAAVSGGGLASFSSGSYIVESSIISGNSAPSNVDVQAFTVSVKNSAIGSTTGFTIDDKGGNLLNQPHANLKLGALLNNGGPTDTILPAADSPLVGKGANPAALVNDQRGAGYGRDRSGIDIGAVEARTNFVVSNANDAGTGSLRQAVLDANAFIGADTITFDPTFFATAQTIALTTGEIAIAENLTIAGPGAKLATVSGGKASRIFNTTSAPNGSTITFSGLALTDGKTTGQGGAVFGGDEDLVIIDCALVGNSAGGNGGAVRLGNFAALTITGSTLSGNTSGKDGGAISTYSVLTMTNSTIAGNRGKIGGGALTTESSTIRNSTIVGNTASAFGGGLIHFSTYAITYESAIVSGNTAPNGPDLYSAGAPVTANFSAIGSKSGVTSFTGDATTNALLGQNFKLGALADNGGPMQTILPLPGSPLVDAGSNPTSLTTDQRGLQRVVGSQIDIGAAEAVNLVVTNANDSGSGSLRQTLEHANDFAGADTVTFDPTFFATAQTITLTSALTIGDAMTLTGPGARLVRISGNNAVAVVNMDTPLSGQVIAISDVTIADGKTGVNAGFFNRDEAVSFYRCAFTNNSASSQGVGAVALAPGSLLIDGCTVSGNTADNDIGGIGGGVGTTITVRNSTFTNNSAGDAGGALVQLGTLLVENSTIVGNAAGTAGGGIFALGVAMIESSIVSGNSSPSGADIVGYTVPVKNSAIGSTTGFTLNDLGGNVLNQPHANLKLAALANNGGPTDTFLPAIDSPLVGKGSNPAALTTDQRGAGYERNHHGIDIGAVEVRSAFVVTNDNNLGIGSLRQAVLDANAYPGADTITFDTTFFATPRTITLTTGQMNINESLTISGPGAKLVTVDGANAARMFNTFIVDATNSFQISGLTLANGFDFGSGGAIRSDDEVVTISDCVLTGNSTNDDGGAIAMVFGGSVTLIRSTVSNNIAPDAGGGIFFYLEGSLSIIDCAIFGNSSGTGGGGVDFGTFSGNNVLISNTTISGNTSGAVGGGIRMASSGDTLTVRNSTITGNSAVSGGGIGHDGSSATINLTSTIVSGNSAGSGPDVFTAGTGNLTDCLLGSASGITTLNASGSTGLLLGKAPNLGPLADNGGPTKTHMLLANSPAIGQGSNPAPALTTDQRGVPRVVGNIDIGAYEVQPAPTATVKIDSGTGQRSMIQSLTVTFSEPVYFTGSAASAITLQRLISSTNPTPNGFVTLQFSPASGPASAFTITFNDPTFAPAVGLAKSLIDGKYQLLLDAMQIRSAATFEPLDGDANGSSGDSQATNFHRLFGDVRGSSTADLSGNGFTDNVDLVAFRNANGSDTTSPNYDPALDFNGDGFIDNVDFLAFRQRLGTTP